MLCGTNLCFIQWSSAYFNAAFIISGDDYSLTCGSKSIQTLERVSLFSQNSQRTKHQLPETHTQIQTSKNLRVYFCKNSFRCACRPVGLHLAVEVGVTLLRGGVVWEELDVGSEFFHDFIRLAGGSC